MTPRVTLGPSQLEAQRSRRITAEGCLAWRPPRTTSASVGNSTTGLLVQQRKTERVAAPFYVHEAGCIRAGRCGDKQLMRAASPGRPETFPIRRRRGLGIRAFGGHERSLAIRQSNSCHTDLANAQAHAHISVAARHGRDPGVALGNRTTRVLVQAANLPVGFQHSGTVSGRFLEPP